MNKLAKFALLGVAVMMFLVAAGCGSDSTAGDNRATNLNPQMKAGGKVGGKHNPATFVSTE